MTTRDFPFMFIPSHILARKDLTTQEKNVFGMITGLTKNEGYCYASNQWIGDILGITSGRVSKHISKLVKKGFISLEIKKIKKKERTGQTGEKYGTIRKIFAYQIPQTVHPLVENDQPPLVENDQCIRKKERIDVGGARRCEPTPNQPLLAERYKRLPILDQVEILSYVMGIYETINIDSLIERIKKSSGRKNILLTAYQWLYRDILEGKIGTNYYLEGFRDDLPKSIDEAKIKIEEQLFLPALKIELVEGKVVTTPGIKKMNPERMNILREKLESLEKVEKPKYDL